LDVARGRFQGFARALQAQTADAIALRAHNATYRELLHENLTSNRALERHNAQPNSIAEDSARFGLDIWTQVDRERSGNDERRKKLVSTSRSSFSGTASSASARAWSKLKPRSRSQAGITRTG
jgi:hypothetical protein